MTLVEGFLAFVVTVAFMFSLRPLAKAAGLIDIPGGRKRHTGRVPLIGGIAMSIGLGAVLTLVPHPGLSGGFFVGVYLLVALGIIDDRFDLSAASRFMAQLCAALFAVFGAGLTVTHLALPPFFDLPLGVFSVPFSLLFIVTIINAFNLIDGLDGLAGGMALLAFAVLAVLGYGTAVFSLSVLFASVVAAFLMFNLPLTWNRPVRAFMGDAGSTALGFAVACLGIKLTNAPDGVMSPVLGLWLVAVPVFDLFCVFVRRIIEKRSPFAPDHQHLHHMLVAHGVPRRVTLLAMLLMGVICAGVGVAGHMMGLMPGQLLLVWLGAGVAYFFMAQRPRLMAALVLAVTPADEITGRRAAPDEDHEVQADDAAPVVLEKGQASNVGADA